MHILRAGSTHGINISDIFHISDKLHAILKQMKNFESSILGKD